MRERWDFSVGLGLMGLVLWRDFIAEVSVVTALVTSVSFGLAFARTVWSDGSRWD